MKDFFSFVNEFQKKNEPFAIATVVQIKGSSSAKPAAKAVINQVGDVIYGWVGGGCAEAEIREEALKCLGLEKTALIDIQMNAETLKEGMACGGQMQVFIEPILPKPTLWILGHNQIAQMFCVNLLIFWISKYIFMIKK
jgi:xanthine dehydrogenase accessory factor